MRTGPVFGVAHSFAGSGGPPKQLLGYVGLLAVVCLFLRGSVAFRQVLLVACPWRQEELGAPAITFRRNNFEVVFTNRRVLVNHDVFPSMFFRSADSEAASFFPVF